MVPSIRPFFCFAAARLPLSDRMARVREAVSVTRRNSCQRRRAPRILLCGRCGGINTAPTRWQDVSYDYMRFNRIWISNWEITLNRWPHSWPTYLFPPWFAYTGRLTRTRTEMSFGTRTWGKGDRAGISSAARWLGGTWEIQWISTRVGWIWCSRTTRMRSHSRKASRWA